MDKSIDITLFGATGFVGALTAEYLASHAPATVRIALAGRNQRKLEDVKTRVRAASGNKGVDSWPIVIADSFDDSALRTMASNTRVVISTVGPYSTFGEQLVTACVDAGTHYVDLCGETLFMARSKDRFHEAARNSGAQIVHACGFDSVPSDIGVFLLGQEAARHGDKLRDVTLLMKMKGGLSGGTLESGRTQFVQVAKDKQLARKLADPYALVQDRAQEPDRNDTELGQQPDYGIIRTETVGARSGWAAPFMMAGSNTRVVRRSNGLLGHAYGPRLRYREFLDVGTGPRGRIRAYVMAGVLAGFGAVMRRDRLWPLASRFLPAPGEGPSEESRNAGFFSATHYGLAESGARYTAKVSAQGDPGYKATSAMLSEAALTLALGDEALPGTGGGVLTPATGLGMAFVQRLRNAGLTLAAHKVG